MGVSFARSEKMKGIGPLLVAALIALTAPPALAAVHEFSGRCDQCHLEETPVSGDNLRGDIETLCRRCHRLPQRYNHPSGIPLAEGLPAPFNRHGHGQLTCTTCHDPHPAPSAPTARFLRSGTTGSAFCESCHPQVDETDGRHLAVTPLAHRKGGIVPLRSGKSIDSPSLGCLACHDGSAARAVTYCLPNSRGNCEGHVVGVPYAESAGANPRLVPVDALAPEIYLPDGVVSCLSCHSPYSDTPHMVVTTAPGSFKLCTECHRM